MKTCNVLNTCENVMGGPDGFPVAVYVSLLRFFLLDDVTPCLICENVTAESEPQVSHKSISLWSNPYKK